MATVDEVFQEKLRARREGRTPVVTTTPPIPTGNSRDAIDARFRAKLVARAAPPAPEPEPKPDKPKAPDPKIKATEQLTEPKPDKPKH